MGSNPTPSAKMLKPGRFVNVLVVILVIALIGVGAYFVLSQLTGQAPASTPSPASQEIVTEPITVNGEIVCLPKTGGGAQTLECAIGLRTTNGQHYGLKNLFKVDPEYKYSTTGLRVEVYGALSSEKMKGPDGNKYDVVGTIDVASIKEVSH